MNKIIASLMLLFVAVTASAQNKATVKGILADSLTKNPLEYATVAVVNTKDTSLISYTLSDKNGGFNISGIPVDRPVKLIISYVGYKTLRQNLELIKGQTKDLGTILFSGNNLNEVVIKGERSPIVIKKDTIEFNTEAFKTRPNAVVEELLRKLPGVQVNVDGSILVNGKSINKLLIDGKQFFGTDPKVATKNLDADLIDKIQVYDDRENDPDHKLSETEVGKIINLKLKSKIKKSTLGKFYAGGGTRDRYEAAGILSNFRDTLQVSIMGLGNNLSKTGFSSDDLYNMGGFRRSGGSQVYDGTFGGRGWGMEKVASGGININNDYGTKLKINLLYFYTNTNRTNKQTGFHERTLTTDTLLSSFSKYSSDNTEKKHAIGGLIEWNPDTLKRFRYEPNINFTNDRGFGENQSSSFNNFVPRLNENNGHETSLRNDNNFSHNFSYHQRLRKKGASVSITHSLSLNKNISDEFSYNDLISFTTDLKSEILDRYADHRIKSNSGNIAATVNYPLSKKISAEFSVDSRLSSTGDQLQTFSKNNQSNLYDQFLPGQSNELLRTSFTQAIKPGLTYQLSGNYRIRAGLSAEYQDVNNKFNSAVADINKSYYNFFPSLEFSGPSFSVNFSESLRLPEISQMQPIERIYSQLYKSTGNPSLKAGRDYRFSGNIYTYIHKKQLNFNAYSSLTLSENNVINKTTIDGNGASTSSYVNKKGGMRAHVSGSIGKQFKKSQNWQIGLNANFYTSLSRQAFFLNEDEGMQHNYDASIGQGISFNYNELLSINTNYNFNSSIAKYLDVNYETVRTHSHNFSGELNLRWPKKVVMEGKYSFNYNPQVAQGFPKSANILNLSVALQMMMKDRAQIKLSVYDLFDQNISVFRYAYNNAVSSGEQEILKRYFLLTYQYKINIYKGK